MRLSSGVWGGLAPVGVAVAEDGVEHVDASAGEGEDGLVMGLAFGALAPVVRLRGGVAGDRDERGLVEHAFERAIAGAGALQVADLAGLFQDGGQACRGGEVVAVGVAGDPRSEEHTSELQSLMRSSYAVFC